VTLTEIGKELQKVTKLCLIAYKLLNLWGLNIGNY